MIRENCAEAIYFLKESGQCARNYKSLYAFGCGTFGGGMPCLLIGKHTGKDVTNITPVLDRAKFYSHAQTTAS